MIPIRTPEQVAAVALLSLFAALVAALAVFVWLPFAAVPWLAAACSLRGVRRAIKPVALWWNAWQYKVSEEEIDWLNYTRKRMYQLALVDGAEARYYVRCGLNLEAQEHRQRMVQRKLRARRDWINSW